MSIRLNPLYSVVHPQYISPSCVPYPPSSLHPLSSQPQSFIFQHPCFTKITSTSILSPPFFIIHPSIPILLNPSRILHPPFFMLQPLFPILHSPFYILRPSCVIRQSLSSILHPPLFILQPPFSFLHSPSFILHPSCFIPQPSSSILYFSCSNFYFISTILNPLSSVLHASFPSLHHPSSIPRYSYPIFQSLFFILNPLSSVLYASFASLHALSFIIHPPYSTFILPSPFSILYPLSIYLYSPFPWIHYPPTILLSQYAITSYYISFIRFLLRYENFLRKVDCRVTLPYWDWSLFAKGVWRTGIDDIWSNKPWGLGGNGRKKKSHRAGCVKTGRFSQRKWRLTPSAKRGCLRRKFSGTVYIMTAIPFDWLLYSFRRALNY